MCFDTEPCEVWSQETRRARKPHRCCSCLKAIEPGQLYVYCSGIFDDSPFAEKVCSVCDLLKERIVEMEVSHGCSGIEAIPPNGEIWEYATESGMDCPFVKESQERLEKQRKAVASHG